MVQSYETPGKAKKNPAIDGIILLNFKLLLI